MPQTLVLGSTGEDVILLQSTLNSRPPTALPLLLVDGYFGPVTQERVVEFQRNNGLLVDGVVGPITWNKLLEEKPIKGYWDKTWSRSNPFPKDSTLGIAFSGWAAPDKALSESAKIKEELVGDKYISLGGGESEGDTDGKFDNSKIERIIAAIKNSEFSGYKGIAFDIEKCDTGLAQKFHEAFVTAKNNNLQVLVTVSHTAPYGAADAKDLMTAFFVDENIDYLSPQLYTNGEENQNDFTEIMEVKWTDYVGAKAAIVPSIVRANLYNDARVHFLSLGINTKGFIQWANN